MGPHNFHREARSYIVTSSVPAACLRQKRTHTYYYRNPVVSRRIRKISKMIFFIRAIPLKCEFLGIVFVYTFFGLKISTLSKFHSHHVFIQLSHDLDVQNSIKHPNVQKKKKKSKLPLR